MRTRFLTAALASVILNLGMGTTITRTTNVLVDSQEPSNPTKVSGKCTDPLLMTADRTANTSVAGGEAVPTAGGSDTSKPIHKKYCSHKKFGSTTPGGTNSAGDMPHSDVQAGGNDAATATGNSYPGSSKQGQ